MMETGKSMTTYQDPSTELGFEEGWELSQGLSQDLRNYNDLENMETGKFLSTLGVLNDEGGL